MIVIVFIVVDVDFEKDSSFEHCRLLTEFQRRALRHLDGIPNRYIVPCVGDDAMLGAGLRGRCESSLVWWVR